MPGTTAAMQEQSQSRLVGGIPVRNLWLLLLYASKLYHHCVNNQVSVEENPDEIPDLVAEILAYRTEQRLRKNLTCAYQGYEADLTRVRGRIDLLRSERHQLPIRGRIACRYEDLTVNTCRNRFVLAALGNIARIVLRQDLAHRYVRRSKAATRYDS
jgi:5-methylcytosine-specific restriction enzyme subunit McrC